VTTYDNVNAQHRLLVEEFGITSLRLVAGWSMGAMAAYGWAALFPDSVRAIVPIGGSARTGTFNKVFLVTRYFWRVFAAPSYPIRTGTMASMVTRRRFAA
jgi:homoserine acetyltransferase